MAQEERRVLTYSGSGVNYDMMDPFKVACQKAAATTGNNSLRFDEFGIKIREIPQSRGESGFRMTFETTEGVRFNLVRVEEGIGSKDTIAKQVRESKLMASQDVGIVLGKSYFRGATIDNGATIFNDISTSAASPIDLMTFIAAGSSGWFVDEEKEADIIDGNLEVANLVRAVWGGGESQALRDKMGPNEAVMAGSSMGIQFIDRALYPSEDLITPGLRIVLFECPGPQTNGFTMLRTDLLIRIATELMGLPAERALEAYGYDIGNGQTYGEAILTPSKIATPIIDSLVLDPETTPIKYALHISGHSWRKLMRANRPFTYVIDQVPTPPPIFQFIQETSGMDNHRIYADYNMGAYFALFVDPENVDKVKQVAQQHGQTALDAGYVEEGPKRVIIRPVDVEYKGEELQIR